MKVLFHGFRTIRNDVGWIGLRQDMNEDPYIENTLLAIIQEWE